MLSILKSLSLKNRARKSATQRSCRELLAEDMKVANKGAVDDRNKGGVFDNNEIRTVSTTQVDNEAV